MEAKARARYVRISPTKARRVIDLVRGRHVEEARRILKFSPLGAARTVAKILDSAVANAEHELVAHGKAGKSRWLGKRPKVRGVAMNPVDHPLGGGEGKSSGGRHPVSPWGKPEGRTRRRNKPSDRMILRRRGKGRGR